MLRALRGVVVYQPRRLHQSITGSWPQQREAATLQRLAQGFSCGHDMPAESINAARFWLYSNASSNGGESSK